MFSYGTPETKSDLDENELIQYSDSLEIAKMELVKEIDAYIKQNSKNSRMSGVVITDMCIKHNFDIPLLLSQAHLEGHFATRGRTKTTGSAFGVGLYDNGVNKFKFSDPNDSIEPYIFVVKNNYICDKNIEDLLRKGFTNKNNQRYASADGYAKKINGIRNKIKRNTNIDSLYIVCVNLSNKIQEIQG